MSNPTKATLGDLSLATEDGTVLTDRTDVGLARQWAQHTHGPGWDALTYGHQMADVADTLAELRRVYAAEPGENR